MSNNKDQIYNLFKFLEAKENREIPDMYILRHRREEFDKSKQDKFKEALKKLITIYLTYCIENGDNKWQMFSGSGWDRGYNSIIDHYTPRVMLDDFFTSQKLTTGGKKPSDVLKNLDKHLEDYANVFPF